MDKAGYYALECWGGATYDSAIRFLNEDPWERLREIKTGPQYKAYDVVTRTKLNWLSTLCR